MSNNSTPDAPEVAAEPVAVTQAAKDLCNLVYAHHVIKYDPDAAQRCAEQALNKYAAKIYRQALRDAYEAGADTKASYEQHDGERCWSAVLDDEFRQFMKNYPSAPPQDAKPANHRTNTEREADELANPCAKIFDHKWLDPECVETGCQSLVWKSRYEAAVKGRQDFRRAYRAALSQVRETAEIREE